MNPEFIFEIVVVISLTGLYVLLRYLTKKSQYKIVSTIKVDDLLGEYIITLENSEGKNIRYRGSCTVWHNADTGQRATTSMEYMLSNIYMKQRWNEQDAKRKENK